MTTPPEFSRLLSIEGMVPDKVRNEDVVASAAECAAVAKRLGLVDIEKLEGSLAIRRVSGGDILRISGRIVADVVQTCVVSLQDVPAEIDATFETFFSQSGDDPAEHIPGRELAFTAEDEESPEMVVDGMIDLGEVVVQYLSLNLDPYPRAPGVSLAAQLAKLGQDKKDSPFAVLEKIKAKKDKEGEAG